MCELVASTIDAIIKLWIIVVYSVLLSEGVTKAQFEKISDYVIIMF
jgi:hypothetical protein